MKIKIYPSKCCGTIKVPPSKSFLHRALIAAALANGESIIHNVNYSNDINETINCLKKIGTTFVKKGNSISISSHLKYASLKITESATTLRFLIPILLVLFKKVEIEVDSKLQKRPLIEYEKLFKEKGLNYRYDNNRLLIEGTLKGGNYKLTGNISSQFISGLLYALPLLSEDSVIRVKELVSLNYIFMTMQVLKEYGVSIKYQNKEFYIKGKQRYLSRDYSVEGDYSQAAFFIGLATINSDLCITGLNKNTLQGDQKILSYIKYDFLEEILLVKKTKLDYLQVDLNNIPDLAPVLFVLAMINKGGTFKNIKRLKYKESNRITDFLAMVKDYQVDYQLFDNELNIKNCCFPKKAVEVNGYLDHRLVMAMAILASVSKYPITIIGADAVNKSYPAFFKDLKSLGIEIELIK